MTYRTLTTLNERRDAVRVPSGSYRPLKTFPPERHSDIVRRPGGIIKVPGRLISAPVSCGSPSRLTRLLLNVTIERSLGPVQVVISPEKTTGDLIKAALDIYSREKRRPLLPESDPHRFELHYSQFSLESLKREEKLINLGSRNFFMCSKPSISSCSSCSEEAKMTIFTAFPLTKLMDFLL
ncbi:uncharacterized protein At4g22758-like [Corylus avellana]|uniref:uncharacterized protein At4g22758-like n=1 Tax=Corylus avellana TaxID=13451 RepID=UPI001E2150D2|nr:uncharacterized protein At4g22758-like [Corylus avellana]